MKKKIVSTLLCTAMLVTMMAGCGGNNAAKHQHKQWKQRKQQLSRYGQQ